MFYDACTSNCLEIRFATTQLCKNNSEKIYTCIRKYDKIDYDYSQRRYHVAGKDIETLEDLHAAMDTGMGPFGRQESAVQTATIYLMLRNSLLRGIWWREHNIKSMKAKQILCDETGFPNFPLGMFFK